MRKLFGPFIVKWSTLPWCCALHFGVKVTLVRALILVLPLQFPLIRAPAVTWCCPDLCKQSFIFPLTRALLWRVRALIGANILSYFLWYAPCCDAWVPRFCAFFYIFSWYVPLERGCVPFFRRIVPWELCPNLSLETGKNFASDPRTTPIKNFLSLFRAISIRFF